MDRADFAADADRLGDFWDGLMQGEPAAPDSLDAGSAAVVRYLHALYRPPAPDPTFLARLEERLMPTTAISPALLPPLAPAQNGRTARSTSGLAPLVLPTAERRRSATAHLSTAALLLLTLGSIYVAFVSHRGADRDNRLVPGIATSPAVSTSDPVEFLWQTKGGSAPPLADPSNPAIDPRGNLWVADGRNNRFQIFAADGTFLEAWGIAGSGAGQFDFVDSNLHGGYGVGAIAFDAAGNFYVGDTANHRVQKFGPDRAFITAWGAAGTGDGQFRGLSDVAVDQQGRVYVTDYLRRDVQVFGGDGRFLTKWGDAGGGIAIDAAGNVWVSDYQRHVVRKFSRDGTVLATFGGYGAGEGQLTHPNDVAVDGQGRVYVAEWGKSRVQVLDDEGSSLATWGNAGVGDGTFLAPNGIALDRAGDVYVSDDGADRVQKFHLRLPPAGDAAPAVETTNEVLLDTAVADLPVGHTRIVVAHWRFRPGGAMETRRSVEGPVVIAVDAGTIVAGEGATEQTLTAGNQLVVPPGRVLALRNPDSTESRVFIVDVAPPSNPPADMPDPTQVTVDTPITTATQGLPSGLARIVLERLTLPAGSASSPYRTTGSDWLGVGAGQVGLTLKGDASPFRWQAGDEQEIRPGQPVPLIAAGTMLISRNIGDDPLVLYRLRITPDDGNGQG